MKKLLLTLAITSLSACGLSKDDAKTIASDPELYKKYQQLCTDKKENPEDKIAMCQNYWEARKIKQTAETQFEYKL